MRELPLLIFLWVLTLLAIYSPLLTKKLKPEVKKWINVTLLTFAIPQLINLIARAHKQFGKMGVDYNFMLWSSLMTFGLFAAYIQNDTLADKIGSFGGDIESTGTTLALLIPSLMVSMIINYYMLGKQIYVHYI
jgi:hypothetical protein